MERDPVCGMTVDPQKAAGRSDHQGRTYYFCSPNCKRQFDQNPGRYTGQAQTGSSAAPGSRGSPADQRKG